MAKTKRTKSSKISAKKKAAKTSTTKVNNLPESVQWVLGFLNLRSTPGKQNINKLPSDVRKELKCPPLHSSLKQIPREKKLNIEIKELSEEVDALEKLQDKTLSTKEWHDLKKKTETVVDDEGYVFSRKTKEFLEVEQCSPTLEDFKQFFLKEGIPPKKGAELFLENGKLLESLNTEIKYPETWNTPTGRYYSFELKLYIIISEVLWLELHRIVGNIVHDTKTYDNEGSPDESFKSFRRNILEKYKDCLKDDEVPLEGGYSENFKADYRGVMDIVNDSLSEIDSFPHYGMLPLAIYACILDFSYNHNVILSRLKQCPYCGAFRIQDKQKGRPRVVCENGCDVIYRQTREKDIGNKEKKRKYIRENDKPKIIKHIMKNKFERIWDDEQEQNVFRLVSEERANEIYEEAPQNNTSSLPEFIRTTGKDW